MEAPSAIFRQVHTISGATNTRCFSRPAVSGGSVAMGGRARFYGGVRASARPRRLSGVMLGSGFCDNGHLQYYQVAPPRCDGCKDKEKGSGVMTKKKLKLLKGLKKGLSMFSELGLAMDPENLILLNEVQEKLTSDSAEVLLKQLEQLHAKEKDMKRKRKQDKARQKASKTKTTMPNFKCSSSSSSSSESSDNESAKLVNMNSLTASIAPTTTVNKFQPPPPALPPSPTTAREKASKNMRTYDHAAKLCPRNDTELSSIRFRVKDESSVVTGTAAEKRIEVCMGKKCMKSGAAELLKEFEKLVGDEGVVVGCKCMGKCRSGPNVKIKKYVGDGLVDGVNDSVRVPANSLCTGVGLEDVSAIVAKFLGENQQDN